MRPTPGFVLLLLAAVVSRAGDMPVATRETGWSARHNGAPKIVASGSELVVLWDQYHPGFARIR